jgi:hypothetical protein
VNACTQRACMRTLGRCDRTFSSALCLVLSTQLTSRLPPALFAFFLRVVAIGRCTPPRRFEHHNGYLNQKLLFPSPLQKESQNAHPPSPAHDTRQISRLATHPQLHPHTKKTSVDETTTLRGQCIRGHDKRSNSRPATFSLVHVCTNNWCAK